MDYPPRSPESGRRRWLPTSDYMDERPSMRSGNTPSPRSRKSSDYRDAPRDNFRGNSDRAWPRDSRDRSRSPPREHRVPSKWNSYRPTYKTSPRRSPAHLPTHSHPNLQNQNKTTCPPLVPSPRSNLTGDKMSSAGNTKIAAKNVRPPKIAGPSESEKRAMNIEPTETVEQAALPDAGKSPPQTILKPEANVSKEFGDFLYRLIEEAADLAALKTKKSVAEKELSRRENDFNKTKDSHQKFPATEEVLRKSKDIAKKAFVTIDKKCQEKDAILKDIISRGAARLLPTLQAGSSGQDKALKLQVDTLSNRCLELENRVQNQQAFIQNQRQAREFLDEKYNNLVEKMSLFDKGLENFKLKSSETTQESQRTKSSLDRIGEKVNNIVLRVARYDKNIEDTKLELSENTRLLSNKLPEDLNVTLSNLSTHFEGLKSKIERIESLRVLDADRNREDQNIATSKALADSTQTIASYGRKLMALETFVHGNGIKPGHAGHISSLVDDQAGLREELLKAHVNWSSVVERMTEVESQTSRLDVVEQKVANIPSYVELVDLRSRISVVESGLSNASLRLSRMEERPAAENHWLNQVERTTSLEKRVSKIEETRSTLPVPADQSAPATSASPDFETLKGECMALVENMLATSDALMGGDIDALKKNVQGIQNEMEIRQAHFYVPLSGLPAKFDTLSKAVANNEQAHMTYHQYLNQIDTKFNNYTMNQQALQQSLDNRVEGVEHGVINLDKRMGLLNTKDMAVHILNQLDSTYPNLRNAQNTLVEQKLSLDRAEARLAALANKTELLNDQILIHKDFVQRYPTDATEALRTKIDELKKQLETNTQLANEAKEAVDTVTKKSADNATVWIEQISNMTTDLTNLKQRAAALEVKDRSTPMRASNGAPSLDRVPLGNGTGPSSGPKIRGVTKQGSVGAEARHHFGEPLMKKRFPNGTPPAGLRRNGVHGHGTPARKRKRMIEMPEPIEVDDSEDSNFEPMQPVISDDEDD